MWLPPIQQPALYQPRRTLPLPGEAPWHGTALWGSPSEAAAAPWGGAGTQHGDVSGDMGDGGGGGRVWVLLDRCMGVGKGGS